MSGSAPTPLTTRPPCCSRTVTSPCDSVLPEVMALTEYSSSSAPDSHPRLDGLQAGVDRAVAVALGHDARRRRPRKSPWHAAARRFRCAGPAPAAGSARARCVTLSSLTSARMSSSKMSLLRSARSLKRANAALTSASESIVDAEFLQALLERVAARQLAQHDLVGRPADVLGTHDFVGVARLQHAVLVDAGGVGECVGADHRLVRLHDEAGGLADHARRRHDLAWCRCPARARSSRGACAPPSPPPRASSCRRARPGR